MKPHCTWLVYLPWFYTFVWLCRFVCVAVWCVDNRRSDHPHQTLVLEGSEQENHCLGSYPVPSVVSAVPSS